MPLENDPQKIATGIQNNRLLTLPFPEGDAPHETLSANRLENEASLSRYCRFVIEILSDNAKLDSKDFVGKRAVHRQGYSGVLNPDSNRNPKNPDRQA